MKTLQVTNTYHFRTTPLTSPNAAQAAHPDQFEQVDATVKGAIVPSWKRLSVEAIFNTPVVETGETLAPQHLALVNELLAQLTQDYVKTQFIDNFLAVGEHGLDAIINHRAEMAARKPSSLDTPSAEALALGEKALTEYLSVAVPKFAPRIAASRLLPSKVTDTAIIKCLGTVEPSRFDNFVNHINTALELVPTLELGADEAATAAALTYLVARMAAFKAKTFADLAEDEEDGM